MFHEHKTIFLQKDTHLRMRKIYHITSNKHKIGTVEETNESAKNLGNQLLTLLSLYSVVSYEFKALDRGENLLGIIKKEKGFYKDFLLFTKEGEHVATVKPTVKVKSPSITVVDQNGNPFLKAQGGYGATDFSITDKNNESISTLKRRSLVYDTARESIVNDDGYYIDIVEQDNIVTFSLIAIGLVIDLYFFGS